MILSLKTAPTLFYICEINAVTPTHLQRQLSFVSADSDVAKMLAIFRSKYMFRSVAFSDSINKKYPCGKKSGYWALGTASMCAEIKFLSVNIFS